jgi:carboxyl-terminal processing protease
MYFPQFPAPWVRRLGDRGGGDTPETADMAYNGNAPSRRGAPIAGVAVLVLVVAGLVVDANKADSDNFYSNIIRLDNVATKVHQNYVEEVSSSDLVDNAIDGMLGILDPHSTYFQEKQYEELRIHTEGEFGGLGIQIAIRDKVLTVMTPISGTPAARAGIQSGDQIIKIDGKSTSGITVDAAVQKLRGQPGTDVAITIRRRGEPADMDYTITREIIRIKSVPYYGVLENGIGYVRLLQFSQESGAEIEKAIKDLVSKGIKGMVLDLRGNPGGLLPQAVEVSEKFLERKALVVSTRGRERSQNREYYSSLAPVLPASVPLAVLVNPASASASEIVAGAIQDWDRGVVLGDTTFGKGSVQSILPLDKEHKLKLTTAFYYTPSGRCINKPENAIRGSHRGEEVLAEDEEGGGPADSAKAADSSSAKKPDTTVYRTQKGRIVFGGGGIVPDTVVEPERFPDATAALFGRDVFFKFAIAEYPRLSKRGGKLAEGYQADEQTMTRFYGYLDSIQFRFRSLAEMQFEQFKRRAGLVKDSSDSAAAKPRKPAEEVQELSDKELSALRDVVQRVDTILVAASRRTLADEKQEIRRWVTDGLLVRALGQDDAVVYRRRLADDKQLAAACAILRSVKAYEALLGAPRK